MTNFDGQYLENIRRIYQEGEDIYSERTGLSTKAIPGMTFEVFPKQGFPLLTLRKIPIKIFCAEVVWMLTGSKNLDFMQQFTKIWDDFAEEDGTMETAYGYRWRHHFGRDQLLDAVQHLKDEPSSRQAVIVMWDPASDGLTAPKKKNVPCPFTWVINIINNKLNLHLIIRSNDMMLGNPHDVAGFALLQSMLAQELGTAVGKLTVSISHAHIYENHYPQVEELLTRDNHEHIEINCQLPPNSFKRGLEGDPELVEELFRLFKEQYKPQPPLEKMKIAV
ncbi:thymidylate synthase [Patescibacteria group bacterium]|nr:thymidylate synthase [Patescibacteria group bacterium]